MTVWRDTPAVPVLQNITRGRFENEIVPAGRPVILENLVADWPIVEAARQSDRALADYLKGFPAKTGFDAWFGPPEIGGRFGYSDDLKGFNHERRTVALAELLDYVLAHRTDPTAYSAYAGGIPIKTVVPALAAAVPMPLLDPGREMLVSLWFGGRSRTAAHWDVPQNLACVAAGRRRFTLFPIDQVGNLYVGPLDFTLAGQAISLVDFDAPDFDRFPKFRDAIAAAQIADLEPGDALYIPSLWWHHVETRDPVGALVNFWWRDGPPHLITPLFTLFHALLSLRDLPAPERAAWQVLFDHYIFQRDGDPMAHLPVAARGLFGTMTPEMLQRLKAFLAGPLK